MPTEKELLDRIRQLEEVNNRLQDKLDLIYSIVAHDEDGEDAADEAEPDSGLVQIDGREKPAKSN